MTFFHDILKLNRKALLTTVAFLVFIPFYSLCQVSCSAVTTHHKSIHVSVNHDIPVWSAFGISEPQRTSFNGHSVIQYPDKGKKNNGDTVKVKKHSARTASWMSAAVPGLGQIYNGKYWKLPIIYGGFGVLAYLGIRYHGKYVDYRDSYYYKKGVKTDISDPYPLESEEIVLSYRDFYRRNFELTCVIGGLLYILNVVDASVDAHLYKFDVSDDLSFRVEPQVVPATYGNAGNPGNGIKLTMKF